MDPACRPNIYLSALLSVFATLAVGCEQKVASVTKPLDPAGPSAVASPSTPPAQAASTGLTVGSNGLLGLGQGDSGTGLVAANQHAPPAASVFSPPMKLVMGTPTGVVGDRVAALRGLEPRLLQCATAAAKFDPAVAGSLTLEADIDTEGDVGDVRPTNVKLSANAERFELCAKGVLKRTHFSAGPKATARVPLTFGPPG